MADAIPAANAELLAAQAKSGLDGVAAYKAAQDTLASQKQAAVQQAMQESAMRGSPAGAMDSQAGIIATPYDQRIASLRQGQGSFEADMAARDRRMADYSAATNQARTLIPGEVEKVVAPIRAAGEANVRNTEREGQMQVSAIDANTRLALARMQAAAQAAAIAAAKKAAGDKAKANKLTGTDLTAMVSAGALGHLQTAASGKDAAIKNEADQTAATKAFEAARAAEITQGQRNRLQNINEGYNGTISPAVAAMKTTNTPQFGTGVPAPMPGAAPVSVAGKPVPPSRKPGQPLESYQAALDIYKQQLAVWTAQQSATSTNGAAGYGGRTGDPQDPGRGLSRVAPGAAARAQAQAVAKQQQAESMAPLLARHAEASKQSDPTLYSSAYGSFSAAQMAELEQTNPWLAMVIKGSPEQITGANYDALINGVPDQYGQTTAYSHTVAQSAAEQAGLDLQGQGYDISEADFRNATGLDIKPGETIAQYNARSTGQMLPQDQAKAVADQQAAERRAIDEARADNRYAVWERDQIKNNTPIGNTGLTIGQMTDIQKVMAFNKMMGTTDPETGMTINDPNTGLPITASPAQQAAAGQKQSDQQASQWILKNLPSIPPSSFGSESDVKKLATATTPGAYSQAIGSGGGLNLSADPPFMRVLNLVQQIHPDLTFTEKEWSGNDDAITTTREYLALTPAQKALLKHYITVKPDKATQ